MTPHPPPAPPPDRLLPHLIWEAVLAIIAILLVVAFLIVAPSHAAGGALENLIDQVGYSGLVAAGVPFSLRTGTPNLAVGALATAAAAIGAHLAGTAQWPVLAGMAVGVVVATIAGALIGLVTGLLSMPAWAVTLGAASIVTGITLSASREVFAPVRIDSAPPDALWLVLFLVVSLGGAFVWRVPGVRSALSASRTDGDPGRWAGWRAAVGAVAGLTVSSLLAALGGVAFAFHLGASEPSTAESLTLTAVAAALLGGASVFGRRAGIAGTVLAVLVVQLVRTTLTLLDVTATITYLVIGLLLVAGLAAGRLLESVTNSLGSRAVPPPATTTS